VVIYFIIKKKPTEYKLWEFLLPGNFIMCCKAWGVCVCVCVRDRETERERQRERAPRTCHCNKYCNRYAHQEADGGASLI
jgi:hypothetical protein